MDALDRMFHVLLRQLRAKHQALLTSPFTVADLHQQILPYRHFRRDLGLETNQEYELILMELLSGARGYLDVDERLRDELGRELAAATPQPARVRDFADAQVSVNADARQRFESREAPAPPASAREPSESSTRCRYCGSDLPAGRTVNFCPQCGQNLQVHNCPACGAELEAEWKYCVACGKAAT